MEFSQLPGRLVVLPAQIARPRVSHRLLVPRFKALCRRKLKEAKKKIREFWTAYRRALLEFREKEERRFFPPTSEFGLRSLSDTPDRHLNTTSI